MQRPAILLLGLWLTAILPANVAAELAIDFNGLSLEQSPFGIFVLPGQAFEIATAQRVQVTFDGAWQRNDTHRLTFTAPSTPGRFQVRLDADSGTDGFDLNGFVMHPTERLEAGTLSGYRIGQYPERPLRNNPSYLPPSGFVKVTRDNRRLNVSPSFTLGQFTSKQSTAFPKFVTLRPELLLKLERIKSAVERATNNSQSIVIMSGYRTPYYNQAIGNVRYSRHVYGDAADIYFDSRPKDGIMDDLDGDGSATKGDARWLYRVIDEMSRQGDLDGLQGGLGLYGSNAAHGPFVHVDVRGQRARWGS